MKKIISFLVIFFVSQKLAFSLNENDFKEFCESVNTRHIPIVNFCILTIYSDNENKSEYFLIQINIADLYQIIGGLFGLT